jgi:hypothetical protein
MSLFDTYIFVDWGAKNDVGPHQPTKDNVWIGTYHSYGKYCEEYFRSRDDCIKRIFDLLKDGISKKRLILIGFDFPYAYPKCLAYTLGYKRSQESWRKVWEDIYRRIKDEPNNNNNRFQVANDLNAKIGGSSPGPFWGRPNNDNFNKFQHLSINGPGFPYQARNGTYLAKFRITESKLRIIHESWGLFGQGRAGSQALVGIPRLYYLRTHDELSGYSKVWPFETGFTQVPVPKQGPFILHAEIWPGIVRERATLLEEGAHFIRDQAQVRAMCQWAAKKDDRNELGGFFGQPTGLSEEQMRDCLEEEGWILGAV